MTVSEEIFGHRREANLRNHNGRLSLIQTLLLFLQSVSLVYFSEPVPTRFRRDSPYMDIQHEHKAPKAKEVSLGLHVAICVFLSISNVFPLNMVSRK